MSTLTFCVSELDPCTPDPCQNGGACSVIEGSSFRCDCTENFQGDRCEIGMTYYKITELLRAFWSVKTLSFILPINSHLTLRIMNVKKRQTLLITAIIVIINASFNCFFFRTRSRLFHELLFLINSLGMYGRHPIKITLTLT